MGRITALVTIDTECDFDVRYRRRVPFEFTSITHGIPKFLRPLWDRYEVRPIYFVSPEVLSQTACCRVLATELTHGAILGAHLHSELVPPAERSPECADFACYACSRELEYQKLLYLTRMIEQRFGYRPEWFRAGRFGADLETMQILKALGYRYDSSVTPHLDWSSYGGPDHRRAPEQPYWISLADYYAGTTPECSLGILEVPVTIAGKRLGWLGMYLPDHWVCYTWLRPTHMTAVEQTRLIRRMLAQYQNPVVVMLFHSFEVMVRTSPYVRNRWMQTWFLNRLEAVLQSLHACGELAFTLEPETLSPVIA